ncbi:MAG: YdcF family protein [Candidatus Solibacter sp.]
MGARRGFLSKFLLALAVVAVVLYLARNLWLEAMGSALIHDDGAAKADIAVVLAGDYWGYRLTKGAELVRQGYVPQVLVSGPPGFYGINEADAAIPFAIAKGYPAAWFVPLRHEALSTREEAKYVLDWLAQHHVQSFLLVTSSYHTGRARRIFLSAEKDRGGGPALRAVASDDRFFSASHWWQNRQGRKSVFMEWAKTLTAGFGI